MSHKNKTESLGRLDPNQIASRDLVHLQEITHGTGCGPHKSRRDRVKHKKRDTEDDHA